MNIKNIAVLIAISLTTASTHAYNDMRLDLISGLKTTTVPAMTDYWVNLDGRLEERALLLNKKITAIKYVSHNVGADSSQGVRYISQGLTAPLIPEWTAMIYVSEDDALNNTLFAIRNRDNTVTTYEPGEVPLTNTEIKGAESDAEPTITISYDDKEIY